MEYILGINKNMKTLSKNGWLTSGWTYLLYKNTVIKYIIGPPEEVENDITNAESINKKIYNI